MNSPPWRRCVFVVSFLLLTSFPRYSCGQETAAIGDEATAAAAAAAACDVAGDAIAYDATESVIDLDVDAGTAAADGETACGLADDDAGGEAPDGDAAETTADVADDERSGGGVGATSSDGDDPGTAQEPVVQSGPYVDLLGDTLLSLEMIDETKAQVHQHHTNVALDGKKVVGLYFSADW